MKNIITNLFLLIFLGFSGLIAQINQDGIQIPGITPVYPEYSGISYNQPPFIPKIAKSPGQYTPSDWRAVIDATGV